MFLVKGFTPSFKYGIRVQRSILTGSFTPIRWSSAMTSPNAPPKVAVTEAHRATQPPPTPVNPPEPSKGFLVNVKAYYVARAIDITKIPQGRKIFGSTRRQYDQRSVVIPIDETKNQHMALFNYGSVVFFNIPEEEHEKYLDDYKDAMPSVGLQLTENYKVIIHQNLEKPSVIKAEHLNIKELNWNNITIIATVMAQSVALDYFAQKVDQHLDTFTAVNLKIDSGKIYSLSAKELHQLVASNNMIMTSLLSKVGEEISIFMCIYTFSYYHGYCI